MNERHPRLLLRLASYGYLGLTKQAFSGVKYWHEVPQDALAAPAWPGHPGGPGDKSVPWFSLLRDVGLAVLASFGYVLRRFSPALRSRFAARASFLSAPFLSGPGVSSVAGRPSNLGSERKAARPCLPISPLPRLAWRSRQEPRGAAASLTWRHWRRSMPTLASASSTTLLRCYSSV